MQLDADVLIIGDGPVGQTLGVLLAQRGWRISVVDKWPEPYTMSRAVAFDSEAARILFEAGIGDFVANSTEPSGRYVWQNAEGQVLLDIPGSADGWCSWPDSTSMYQPGLEAALTARGRELANLRVLRGQEAVEVVDHGDHVELTSIDRQQRQHTHTARWLVGCDGANSFVRRRIDPPMRDLKFSRDWLICDVVPHHQTVFEPNNLQVCDPKRPRTAASAGPGHRRWEFMRIEGESVAELNTEQSVWRLLELFDIRPDNATLLRHAVYTFQARWAENWRSGRLLLAGDSAHVMPPFAGQGMCSGIRDAANLTWKLDLVLRGLTSDALLDTYVAERSRHVQHAVRMSVDLGKVICQLDPVAAADRDVVMIAARQRGVGTGSPKAPVHPLQCGLLSRGAGRVAGGLTGTLSPQARLARDGRIGLFDELVGTGTFVMLGIDDARAQLDAAAQDFLQAIGIRYVRVVGADEPSAPGDLVDIDGAYRSYLRQAAARAVLVRPDYYVYGQVSELTEYQSIVEDLRDQISVNALAY
jgi:flavoprotein hydroxylase